MKILFSISDHDACSEYRCKIPARALERHFDDVETEVCISPAFGQLRSADIVVFQRYHSSHKENLELARTLGKVTIFETDDLDIHLPWQNPLQPLYRFMGWDKEIRYLAANADWVTCTTPILAEELSKFNRNVRVFPNMIELDAPQWNFKRDNHREDVVIGWVGGVTHKEDLQIVEGFISQLTREFKHVKFSLCGYTKKVRALKLVKGPNGEPLVYRIPADQVTNTWDTIIKMFSDIPTDQLIIQESRPFDQYPSFFTEFDIIIAPVVDTRFNRSKSELKIIEAGAYGLPVVASRVGMYEQVIQHGETGFLCRNGKDFVKYLRRLIVDKRLRKELGTNLRKFVEKNYDINRKIGGRHQFYKEILERRTWQ